MTRIEADKYSHMSPKELLRNGIKTERIERVPVGNVVKGDDLFDERRAETLAKSMMGSRGQLVPALIRARSDDNGSVVYDIMNGQHRYEGKVLIEKWKNEPQNYYAVVMYGCSDEEYWRHKVLAVHSTASVKFARLAIMMKKTFTSHSWTDPKIKEVVTNKNISLAQVFTLAHFDSSGRNLGFTPDQAEELKIWAKERSVEWDKPLSSLIFEMKTIEKANPEVVRMVRARIGKEDDKHLFTAQKLKKLVEIFPSEWDLQLQLANMTTKHKLSMNDLNTVLFACQYYIEANDQPSFEKLIENPQFLLEIPYILKEHANKLANIKTRQSSNNPCIATNNTVSPGSVPEKKHKSHSVKTNTTPRRHRAFKEGDFRNQNEELILQKHNIPLLFNAFREIIIQEKGSNVVILNLPKDNLELNIKKYTLSIGNKMVHLSPFENELMFVFYIFEGIPLSTELLGTLYASKKGQAINIHSAVSSLREKIHKLCPQATSGLEFHKNKFSWLAE